MRSGSERCPYARPFAYDFDDCSAYQPVQYVPMDLTHSPMRPVWTCGHLASARGEYGGFFPHCRLGDADGRLEWVSRIAADRRRAWQEIAGEFGTALAELLRALYAAKARQVALAGRPGPELRAAEAELRVAVQAFLEADFALMDSGAGRLERIGFPVEATKIADHRGNEGPGQAPRRGRGLGPASGVDGAFPGRNPGVSASLLAGAGAGEAA